MHRRVESVPYHLPEPVDGLMIVCTNLRPVPRAASRPDYATSPLVGRYAPDLGRELGMSLWIDRPMPYRATRRVLPKVVVPLPVVRWSDGSGREAAAAIGTDVAQYVVDAGRTERTLIGADAR